MSYEKRNEYALRSSIKFAIKSLKFRKFLSILDFNILKKVLRNYY